MRNFTERTFAVALTDCWVSDSYKIHNWLIEVLFIYCRSFFFLILIFRDLGDI